MTRFRVAAAAGVLLLVAAPRADAQGYPYGEGPRRGSIEVSGGGAWAPGFDLGTRSAELTRSGTAGPLELFTTETEIGGFAGAHARVGFYLSRVVSVEGGVRYAAPQMATRLSGDFESAADEVATQTLRHYVFDGSVLVHLTRAAFAGGRAVPFVSAGAGQVRELHEGNELVETGTEVHATAGVKYWLGSGRRRLGVRAEVGLTSREGGLDSEGGRRALPLALAGASFVF